MQLLEAPGTCACGAPDDQGLIHRIRGEYLEMPSLCLTVDQAMRLWGMERPTCMRLLTHLMSQGFLERDDSGQYHKVPAGH